jgi:hypothetical protein
MALTITGALNVTDATERETRARFLSTLAGNSAWVGDAARFVLDTLFERGRRAALAQGLHQSTEPARTQELLTGVLPESLVGALSTAELTTLPSMIAGNPSLLEVPRVHGGRCPRCAAGGGEHLSRRRALPGDGRPRGSDGRLAGLPLVQLVASGDAVRRYVGLRPVRMGLAMIGMGAVLAALGG